MSRIVISRCISIATLTWPLALSYWTIKFITIVKIQDTSPGLIFTEDSLENITWRIANSGFPWSLTLIKSTLISQQIIFEHTMTMRLAIKEMPFIWSPINLKMPFSIPFTFAPLSFINKGTFFNSKSLNLVVHPSTFVHPSISIIIYTLSTSPSIFHLSLIPLPIFPDINTLSMILIFFPFPKIDVSRRILENASSWPQLIFELTLIYFPRWILDLLYIGHKLSIGSVDVFLEEGLDDASLFLKQLLANTHISANGLIIMAEIGDKATMKN